MLSLRAALILAIAGSATPAFAEQITCESHQERNEACGTFEPGGNVRLVQQLSNAPCIEGRSWGVMASPNHDSLWVSGGCRAVFEVQAPYSTAERVPYSDSDRSYDAGTSHSPPWQHGFADGERGVFDIRSDSRDYRDGYRAGEDVTRNQNRYSDARNAPDEYADRGGESRASGSRYASTDSPRRVARRACIEQAASGQPYGPDQIRTNDVHWIGRGTLSVGVETPDGPLICTVDRDGNVLSIDSR